MSQLPAIALQDVTKIYANGTVALQDLSLTVTEGEFVSLVGPSGCGKSTVLRLIAGLGEMNSGELVWGDGISPKELAFVFQDAALMPWATVWGNVQLPLKLAGMKRAIATHAIQESLRMVDLQGFEKAYPRELSGGMKMRVSIARALVTRPEILLMDEPFGALDEMTRSRMNTDLLHLWEQKQWTVVFVTHNIYEAVYLANRVVVMAARPGRVIADIPIDAPYPRTEDFRTSPLFNQYCRQISHALSQAMSSNTPVDPVDPETSEHSKRSPTSQISAPK